MKLYCYEIPPIDYWFGALTDKQLLDSAWDNYQDLEHIAAVCKEIADLKRQAEAAFKTIGWDGDVREGPYYFALPGEPIYRSATLSSKRTTETVSLPLRSHFRF